MCAQLLCANTKRKCRVVRLSSLEAPDKPDTQINNTPHLYAIYQNNIWLHKLSVIAILWCRLKFSGFPDQEYSETLSLQYVIAFAMRQRYENISLNNDCGILIVQITAILCKKSILKTEKDYYILPLLGVCGYRVSGYRRLFVGLCVAKLQRE